MLMVAVMMALMRFVEVDFIAVIMIEAVHVFGMITIRPVLMFLMIMRMRFVTMITIRSMNVCFVSVMTFRSMHVLCVAMIAIRSVHVCFVGMAGMRFFILAMRMGRAGVNAKLDPFNALALLALEMHVEIADLQFGKFPLKSRRFDSQIAQGSHGHVAADTGKAVEKKNTHDEVFKRLKN
ncbi:MAG: hypothetical protein JWL90_3371 [Chthoniobacteraceae bacterium]|nr:hypothetical protein [Chthoniobacteraceae bacterium]